MKIKLTPKAESDYNRAYSYYQSIRPNLGQQFRLAIRKKLKFVAYYPFAFAETELATIRRCPVHDFHYSIFYSSTPNYIVVHAIAHDRRSELHWQNRIPH